MIFSISRNKIIFSLVLVCVIFFALAVSAHDGLHEQIIAVTKEISKNPNNVALYLKNAGLYRLHEEWEKSERDFDRAEKLKPNLAIVNLGRGKLWLDFKQFSKAKITLETFLTTEPESYEGVITIARVCAKLKQSKTAVEYFTKAISIAPKDAAEIYLERAEVQSSAGEFVQALAGLDGGIAKFGNLVTLQTVSIDLEIKSRNYDAALERLDELSATMPQKESFLLRRGEILIAAGRKCQANKIYSKRKNYMTIYRNSVKTSAPSKFK